MPVSDKMIKASADRYDLKHKDGCTFVLEIMNEREATQAAINAAWNPFDYTDKTTWPPNNPFKNLLVETDDGHITICRFGTRYEEYPPMWSSGYIRIAKWADTEDFRYAD